MLRSKLSQQEGYNPSPQEGHNHASRCKHEVIDAHNADVYCQPRPLHQPWPAFAKHIPTGKEGQAPHQRPGRVPP